MNRHRVAKTKVDVLYPNLWKGLIGYWSAFTNPPGGTVIYELTKRNSNASIVTGLPSSWNTVGGYQGYQVFGSADWINFGTGTTLGWSRVRTIHLKTFFTSVVAGAYTLLSMWDLVGGVNQRTTILQLNATGYPNQVWSPDGVNTGTQITASSVETANSWVSYTSVYRDGVREWWRNNFLIGTATASIYTGATTNRLGFGTTPGRAGDSVNGAALNRFGELRLYDRALSVQEINILSEPLNSGFKQKYRFIPENLRGPFPHFLRRSNPMSGGMAIC